MMRIPGFPDIGSLSDVFCQIRDWIAEVARSTHVSDHTYTFPLTGIGTAGDNYVNTAPAAPFTASRIDIILYDNPLTLQFFRQSGGQPDPEVTYPAPGYFSIQRHAEQFNYKNGTAGLNATFQVVFYD